MGLGLDQLNTLLGTLGPHGVAGLMEAQQAQQQQELQDQADQAARQSQAAASNYQAAAAAAAPSVGGAAFVPTLFSNVASVLSGNRDYEQQNAQRLQAQQGDLMEARRSNLLALRDIQEQKAKAAEHLGDQATAEKARMQHEKLTRTLLEMDQNRRTQQAAEALKSQQEFQGGENELNRLNQLEIARINAASRGGGGGLGGNPPTPQSAKDFADAVASGQVTFAQVPMKQRDAVLAELRDAKTKILPDRARVSLTTLSSAKAIAKRIRKFSESLNQSGPGMNVVTGAGKYLGRVTQQNTDAVVYNRMVNAFLTTLSRATGERGTLTNQDVARAKGLVPNVFDTKATTAELNNELDNFLQEMEDRTIHIGTTVLPQQQGRSGGQPPLGADQPNTVDDEVLTSPAVEDSTGDDDPEGLY